MRLIQGFVTKDSFINNQAGVVNEFFEISPLSLTYSKDHGEYKSSTEAGDVLHTFTTRETTTQLSFTLQPEEVTDIVSIVNTVLAYCTGHSFNSLEFVNYIRTSFASKISGFTHGSLYEGDRYSIPDWTAWTLISGAEVRIWHRDVAFQNQYSFYEIVTVPPLDNLDSFFGQYSTTSAKLKALTFPLIMERVQTAKGIYPESFTRMLTFKYYNPNNANQYTEAQWAVLVYGKNGDNIDSIKDAIAEHVLRNSTKTEAEWKIVFPEIFTRSEFMFFPRWDKVAIQNTTDLGAIYSSIHRPSEMVDHVRQNHPVPMTATQVMNKLDVLPFDYKAITCGVISGMTNLGNSDDIIELFPDYVPVNTASMDFNRMTEKTREWVLKMVELLKTAETATEFSTVVNPMRRVTRNGKLFVCFVYDNVNFLVSVKKNAII